MKYQRDLSDIFEKFRSNEECLQYFLDSFEIPELKNLKELKCSLFSENSLVQSVNPDNVTGFVISNRVVEVFFINPTMNYIGFWGFRNFFTFRLAEKHQKINDGILRYVINIHRKPDPNRADTFNDIREFIICNVYKCSEDLKNWIEALYGV